jgi:hypothetical protein
MLGCLLGLIAFFTPRIAIVLLLLFSNWIQTCFHALHSPFSGLLLPILGLLFAPYTLLAYCLAIHEHGSVGGGWMVLVIVAILFDLGVIGGGRKARTRMRRPQRAE